MLNRGLVQPGPIQSVWRTLVNEREDVVTDPEVDSGGARQGAFPPRPAEASNMYQQQAALPSRPAAASNMYQACAASAQAHEFRQWQQQGDPEDHRDEFRNPSLASQQIHKAHGLFDRHSPTRLHGNNQENHGSAGAVEMQGGDGYDNEVDDLNEVLPATPDEPEAAEGNDWQPGMIG